MNRTTATVEGLCRSSRPWTDEISIAGATPVSPSPEFKAAAAGKISSRAKNIRARANIAKTVASKADPGRFLISPMEGLASF